ncbi:M20 family metallo-hydrolase [Neotamlana laminarinivorans]|uniref:M20 family metallo-hydrolase n=1 Tax=Neotamlana laminarinivorans TaxID=2883124 RepID=A0A9X1HYN9_9FLAO|nr:M20 family metallo-hydrolase [Tamlana laminarinivorans]MCB4798196.1 M20 family metallo-hydrolase [Tamlana laminarinivorans]
MNRIDKELQKLASFSATPNPSVTRIVYSEEDMEARAYFITLCENIGLKVRVDVIGNTFARWEGSQPDLAPVGTGSHIDAIPESGQYDGTVGVFGGLEAIRVLKESGYSPKRSIEILLFTSEEPTRFGIGCLGSRMLSGQLTPENAEKLIDTENNSLKQNLERVNFNTDLSSVKLPKNYYNAFVELHIEQGPILEAENLDIGIVTMIAAPSSLGVQIVGQGGHAGCVLMPKRKDAGCAAAEIALAVESIAQNSASDNTVATTGIFNIKPGAVNSIPKEAYLEIDLRDTFIETRDKALNDVQDKIKEISNRRGVTSNVKLLNCDPPAICAENLVNTVENVTKNLGYSYKKMISHAYHDSLFMAQICPTTMIFIPCRDGLSHHPDEYSSPEQIHKGVQTLALSLKALSE